MFLSYFSKTIVFINAILIGSALHYLEKELSLDSLLILFLSIVVYLLCMNVYVSVFGSTTTYHKPGAIIFAILIACSLYTCKGANSIGSMIFKMTGLGFYARCCYSFYLLHVTVGLFVMYYLRDYIDNSYILILSGFVASSFVAEFLRITVEDNSIRLARNSKLYINKLSIMFSKFRLAKINE